MQQISRTMQSAQIASQAKVTIAASKVKTQTLSAASMSQQINDTFTI